MRLFRHRFVVLWVLSAVTIAACSDSSDSIAGSAEEPSSASPTSEPQPSAVPASPTPSRNEFGRIVYEIPDVDTSIASVALDDVIFDTFGAGPLNLASSTVGDRLALLDAIPPIDDPEYVDPVTDPWLLPDDPVLGYVDESGQAYAHPHKILALHEIVNVVLDDGAVLISYCPLCDSGVVYSRVIEAEGQALELRFSNTSALFDNDLVMVDRQTGSYWFQVAGRAIVGPLTDTALGVLPSTTMRWSQWQELHPDTLVLSRELGFDRDYTQDRFAGYADRVDQGVTPFPVADGVLADPRLSPATRVVLVDAGSEAVAVAVTEAPSIASFDVDGEPIIVLSAAGTGAAFSGLLDGLALDLAASPTGFTDTSTGITFDRGGVAVDGSDTHLFPVPSRSSFWFAVVAAFPNVIVAPTG